MSLEGTLTESLLSIRSVYAFQKGSGPCLGRTLNCRCKCCLRCYKHIRTRATVGAMIFFACWVNYAQRIGFNIIFTDMLERHKEQKPALCKRERTEKQGGEAPDYGPRYDWAEFESHILSAHGYGYVFTQLAGGVLADIFGGYAVFFFTSLFSSICTALIPVLVLTTEHWTAAFVPRLLVGIFQGFQIPALHGIFSPWVPPKEKLLFVFALLGCNVSTLVMSPLIGLAVIYINWYGAIWSLAGLEFVLVVFWWILVRDAPEEHPWISDEERKFIIKEIGQDVLSMRGRVLPVKHALCSVPFVGLLILHFGEMYGSYFQTTITPKYLIEGQGLDTSMKAALMGIPSGVRVVVALCAGAAGRAIIAKGKLTKTVIRKLFVIFSHVIPGILVFFIGYMGCDYVLAMVLMTASLGTNGASIVTNLSNHHDLAPNFAGTLYGIMNTFATSAAIIAPYIVKACLKQWPGFMGWKVIYMINGIIYVLSAFIYFIMGSGETQYWNAIDGRTGEVKESERKGTKAERAEEPQEQPPP